MAVDISVHPQNPTAYALPNDPYPDGVPSPSLLVTASSTAIYFGPRGHGRVAVPVNKSARIVDHQHS